MKRYIVSQLYPDDFESEFEILSLSFQSNVIFYDSFHFNTTLCILNELETIISFKGLSHSGMKMLLML